MNQIAIVSDQGSRDLASRRGQPAEDGSEFVTLFIGGQLFGIPVLMVRDVLGPQTITRVPRAPPEVAGSLNLRGRIVTAIDLCRRLGLESAAADPAHGRMSVVVDLKGELYSLIVDSVGEVLRLSEARFERAPPTLDGTWREFSAGIYRLEGSLLFALDVPRLMDFTTQRE